MEGHLIGSKESREFKNEFEAWEWIKNNYPNTKWEYDKESSERAGYKTYRDTEEFYNYVCMLNDRLELNLKEGNQTINLWIKTWEDAEPMKAEEPGIWYKLTDRDVARICNRLYHTVAIMSNDDVNRGTYDAMYEIMEDLKLIDRLRNPVIDESEDK